MRCEQMETTSGHAAHILQSDCFITVSSPILQAAVRLEWFQCLGSTNNSETDSGMMPIIVYHDK